MMKYSSLKKETQHPNHTTLKGILCEVPFLGGSALLLSYSVGAMALCNLYTTNNVK